MPKNLQLLFNTKGFKAMNSRFAEKNPEALYVYCIVYTASIDFLLHKTMKEIEIKSLGRVSKL